MSFASAAFTAKMHTVRRDSLHFLNELRRNEQLPRAELTDLENQLAGDAVAFAMGNSPFYTRTYGALGVDPAEVVRAGAWEELPVLDRTTVKEHAQEFPTGEAVGRAVRHGTTGGSTGEPLAVMHDTRVPTLSLAWRMYSWWGVTPWDNVARLGRWGLGRRQQFLQELSWWPTKQVNLEASLLTDESLAVFHDRVVRTRPKLIEGYMGAMIAYADFLERRHLSIPSPHAVATTAAPLTTSARAHLESTMGAPVYDEYRCAEFGWTAGECREHHGLHVFSDVHRIEVLGPDGHPVADGEIGDITITDLRNRVFPLIRYQTGDRGSLVGEPCPCGRPLPLMAALDGRDSDVFHLPSGATLAHQLNGLFASCPDAVRHFQIHQFADYSIVVSVVPGTGPGARARIEKAVDTLRVRTKGEAPVTVDYVDSLPYTGGKVKFVVSDVVTP